MNNETKKDKQPAEDPQAKNKKIMERLEYFNALAEKEEKELKKKKKNDEMDN